MCWNHYAQTNTNNVNKTCALVFMRKSQRTSQHRTHNQRHTIGQHNVSLRYEFCVVLSYCVSLRYGFCVVLSFCVSLVMSSVLCCPIVCRWLWVLCCVVLLCVFGYEFCVVLS
jgi:hypothetical protein